MSVARDSLIASHTRRGAHLSSSYIVCYIFRYIVFISFWRMSCILVVLLLLLLFFFITHMCSVSLVERRIKPVWSRIKRKSIGWKRLLRKQSYTNPYIYTFIWSQTCIWCLALTHALVNRARLWWCLCEINEPTQQLGAVGSKIYEAKQGWREVRVVFRVRNIRSFVEIELHQNINVVENS